MDYAHWDEMPTRWRDNDVYGHLNNVVHYELMDSVINRWLITEAGFSSLESASIGLCVESRCSYKAEAAYPSTIRVGLRIGRLGTSSVRYELGLFEGGRLLAEGEFTHVFVDRVTRRPSPLSGPMRAAMERLVVA
ncbi:acyl-CoA thioesterase [Herbidospora mongoliensis]|uniref:acyl-CoA thioesterase n=1 Tax=Herbidospora mongoliensis TaxID=688067 RepID=UPI000836C01E|nr:thioesterase family protein [Herbidospora mongoliensis]